MEIGLNLYDFFDHFKARNPLSSLKNLNFRFQEIDFSFGAFNLIIP